MPLRVKNISQGFVDATGFYPIRSAEDYRPGRAGEWTKTTPRAVKMRKAKRAKGKAKKHSPARKHNPLSTKWTHARVRRTANGDVQVMLTGRAKSVKAVKRHAVKRRTTKRRTVKRRR